MVVPRNFRRLVDRNQGPEFADGIEDQVAGGNPDQLANLAIRSSQSSLSQFEFRAEYLKKSVLGKILHHLHIAGATAAECAAHDARHERLEASDDFVENIKPARAAIVRD